MVTREEGRKEDTQDIEKQHVTILLLSLLLLISLLPPFSFLFFLLLFFLHFLFSSSKTYPSFPTRRLHLILLFLPLPPIQPLASSFFLPLPRFSFHPLNFSSSSPPAALLSSSSSSSSPPCCLPALPIPCLPCSLSLPPPPSPCSCYNSQSRRKSC